MIDLQKAKAEATARFLEVAAAIKRDAGVDTHEVRSSLSGKAWSEERRIQAPEGKTRNQLYILAHECGHVALGHCNKKPRHRQEFEAERYAHEALRKHGVPVPRKMTERAKRYVRRKLRQAERRGAKKLDNEAVAWSGY